MKRSGFKTLSYEEKILKQIRAHDRRALRDKSQTVKAGKKRKDFHNQEVNGKETEWKKQVRQRDNFQCQYPGCKVRDKHIHCHHISPRSQRRDLLYVVSNGICLCFAHHMWSHDNPIEAETLGLLSTRSYELAQKEGTIGVR